MSKTLKEQKPQDKSYWAKRKLNDKEHDWLDDSVNWVQGYADSIDHPHRELIIKALKKIRFKNVLEVGCNAGPNLAKIEENYPYVELFGFDINKDSIKKAKELVPTAHLKVGDLFKPPFLPRSSQTKYDVVIADAVLMYVQPNDINKIMSFLEIMAKNIIIVDRYSEKDEVCGHVWGRNYTKLLENRGFKVEVIKITKKEWPTSKNWVKYGRVFIAKR
jgi:SAM-dependent methyltransferase